MPHVHVQGNVRDASAGTPVSSGIACLTRDHELVQQVSLEGDGGFSLDTEIPSPGNYLLTVLASGLEGWRRPIQAGEAAVDETLGTIELDDTEYPPGVYGQLWDGPDDRPIASGRASLEQDGARLAVDTVDPDGSFAIELTCSRPLPPGDYLLIASAAGYEDVQIRFHLGEQPIPHQLGRIEFAAPIDRMSPAG
jgi:hypothetical protein